MSSQILQPSGWLPPIGYANGISVPAGRIVFVAGQVGWDAQQRFHSEELVPQFEQALKNIVAVLSEGGARPEHIARMTWYVTSKSEYLDRLPEIGKVYKAIIGPVYPAMSLVQVAGLVETGAKLEIEATAVIPT